MFINRFCDRPYSGTIKNNFNGTNGRFARCDKIFLFMSSVKKSTQILETFVV